MKFSVKNFFGKLHIYRRNPYWKNSFFVQQLFSEYKLVRNFKGFEKHKLLSS